MSDNLVKLYCSGCFSLKDKKVQLKLEITQKNLWHSTLMGLDSGTSNEFSIETETEEVDYVVEFVCPVCNVQCFDLKDEASYDEETETVIIRTLDQSEPLGYKLKWPLYKGFTKPLPRITRPSRIPEVLQDA